MKKFRTPQAREQLTLLPRSVDEFVPVNDSVRFVDALVNEFDLSKIESGYSAIGRPGYSPRVLVKVLVYGKMRGMRSSRELARACRENMRFIFLAQEERPDFRTISDFRKRFLPELGELLKQTVRIGINEGLITLEHVAIDGTKVRANAGAKSFRSKEKLEELLASLEGSLEEDVKRDEDSDQDDDEPKLPKELEDKQKLAERVKQAIKDMGEKGRISLTDSDASFMESQSGCYPSYNGQIAVDAKKQLIVGAMISTAGSDHALLKPMLEEVSATTGKNPQTASADKGYRATEGLVELEERGIEGFVALQDSRKERLPASAFRYDDGEDEYVCPFGQSLEYVGEKKGRQADLYQSEGCGGCPIASDCLHPGSKARTLLVSWHATTVSRMRARMATEPGKQMLRLRAKTVEPVFGWIKTLRKLRQFLVRGRSAVNDAWKFEAAAINVFRIVTERTKLQLA